MRELTFRQVGEGTGKARDLDAFDTYYDHLILWHNKSSAIAGSYRLAWSNDVLPERGPDGLDCAPPALPIAPETVTVNYK